MYVKIDTIGLLHCMMNFDWLWFIWKSCSTDWSLSRKTINDFLQNIDNSPFCKCKCVCFWFMIYLAKWDILFILLKLDHGTLSIVLCIIYVSFCVAYCLNVLVVLCCYVNGILWNRFRRHQILCLFFLHLKLK